jgi:hypothetical protein
MAKSASKVNPERRRARFSKEFKVETVRLLELGQKPAAQLALELQGVLGPQSTVDSVGGCNTLWPKQSEECCR